MTEAERAKRIYTPTSQALLNLLARIERANTIPQKCGFVQQGDGRNSRHDRSRASETHLYADLASPLQISLHALSVPTFPHRAGAERAAPRRERNAPRFRSRPPPCALSALCFSSTHRNVVSYKCKKIRRNRSTPQKISPCNIKKTRYFGQRESPKYRVFSLNLPRGDRRAVEACEVARRNAALCSKATGVYSRT